MSRSSAPSGSEALCRRVIDCCREDGAGAVDHEAGIVTRDVPRLTQRTREVETVHEELAESDRFGMPGKGAARKRQSRTESSDLRLPINAGTERPCGTGVRSDVEGKVHRASAKRGAPSSRGT